MTGVAREQVEADAADGEDQHGGDESHHVSLEEEGQHHEREDPDNGPVALDQRIEDRHFPRVAREELWTSASRVQGLLGCIRHTRTTSLVPKSP